MHRKPESELVPFDNELESTLKNLKKDCMAVTLRSGRGLEARRNEKKKTEEEKHTEIGEEIKQYSS